MRIEAYKNLHLDTWSLRDPKRIDPVEHADHVELHDVAFRIQLGGRAAVLRDGVRRVHAYVVGELAVRAERRRARAGRWYRFTYSPFRGPTFTLVNPRNPRPIYGAARVRLDRDGAWCQGPIFTKPRK